MALSLRTTGAGLLLFLTLANCQTARPRIQGVANRFSPCSPQLTYTLPAAELPHQTRPDAALRAFFSPTSLRVVQAIGLGDSLLLAPPSPAARERLTALVYQRVTRLTLEVAGVMAELDCEEERADQLATLLEKQDDRRERKWTVLGLGISALSDLVAGVVYLRDPQGSATDAIGIVGGGLGTALSLQLLTLRSARIEYRHPRNVLRSFVDGTPGAAWPPRVWWYLSQPLPGGTAPRDQLLSEWEAAGDLATRRDLYLGTGGRYTADQLRARANFFDQLESHVGLFQREIGRFLEEYQVWVTR